ncbi:Uncharacterised protein [Bordetella pertussis]|nr:Uncharacterised protein [Bordetella pertussis]
MADRSITCCKPSLRLTASRPEIHRRAASFSSLTCSLAALRSSPVRGLPLSSMKSSSEAGFSR